MRDLLVLTILLWFCPRSLKAPYVGVLLFSWISYMNPHRMSWGFMYDLPVAMLIFLLTIVGIVFSMNARQDERSLFEMRAPLYFLALFVLWIGVTSANAHYPDLAFDQYKKFIKILMGVGITLYLFNSKPKLILLIYVIAFSIGFFGIKGGVFSVLTGGNFRVWGPPDSFIYGNNELALALIMILPFFYFMYNTADLSPIKKIPTKWIKLGLLGCMLLILVSVIASYSRGAFISITAVSIYLWWQSKQKVKIGAFFVLAILVFLPMMPDSWFERMDTIETYQDDQSAQGRIAAWQMAFNLASERVTGGGYETWTLQIFNIYLPEYHRKHDAHSIYFEVMGEHGFIGLILFLGMYFSVWFIAGSAIKKSKGMKHLEWANLLLRMCKVSLLGYATGGAFLGLAFFDLPYHIIAIIILTSTYIKHHLGDEQTEPDEPDKPDKPDKSVEKAPETYIDSIGRTVVR